MSLSEDCLSICSIGTHGRFVNNKKLWIENEIPAEY